MDFKRVRTFVTVAEHGTRLRILHDQVTQTGRPKSRKTCLAIISPLVFSMHLFPAMSVLTPNSHCAPVMPVIALSAAGH